MAKGKFVIEFDTTGELRAQLEFLLLGTRAAALNEQQALSDAARLQAMWRAAPNIPAKPAEDEPSYNPRGVLGIVGKGMQANPAPVEPRPETPQIEPTKEPEKPADKPPEKPAETAPTSAPAADEPVGITLETLSTAPYDNLLKFCEQNKVVGVDVEKNRQPFFRKLVEMRVRTHLETAAQ